jgi:hypothetical protein
VEPEQELLVDVGVLGILHRFGPIRQKMHIEQVVFRLSVLRLINYFLEVFNLVLRKSYVESFDNLSRLLIENCEGLRLLF